MLILTRRVGESLIIGDDVNVTVLGVKGNQVRLGVNAPKEIRCTGRRSTSGSNRKRRRAPRLVDESPTEPAPDDGA